MVVAVATLTVAIGFSQALAKDLNPNEAGGTTLIFPADKKYGVIYTVPDTVTLRQSHPKMQYFAAARGVVHIPKKARVIFEGNALLAEKPELLAMPPAQIKGLILKELDLSDRAFENAAKLTNLEYLSLEGTEVTDESLKIVGGFHHLLFLEISSTQINGSGFEYLKSAPDLYILRASHNKLKYFDGLSNLAKLDWLDLSSSGLEDAALVPIGKMAKLRDLEVEHSKLTDDGLKYLKNTTHLAGIDIRYSQVTGAGLLNLGKVPLLRVRMSGYRINAKDRAAIMKIFPKLDLSEQKDELRTNANELFAPLH
jgi:hypothetical protein